MRRKIVVTFKQVFGVFLRSLNVEQPLDFRSASRGIGRSGGMMNWHIRLATLFLILALAGCAQGVNGQGQSRYAPYSRDNGNMHDHGGGDGGGGSM